MLVKYYGLVFDKTNQILSPRVDFISNGFFRMTQPKYLNDQGSEARLLPYFNEFSPADYLWARKQHSIMQMDSSYIPSKEELENFFLKPTGIRYGDQYSKLFFQENFQSIDEYDKEQLSKAAKMLNSFIIEGLSCKIGVFSLSKSSMNELMWTHYASEGKGLAVTFDENHPFFNHFIPKAVSYTPDKRASLTYYKGSMRINGVPIKDFYPNSINSYIDVMQSFISKGIDYFDLSQRLLYSKDINWAYEEEMRVVCPLELCDKQLGRKVQPCFSPQLQKSLSHLFHEYSEVNLKRIPFDAFESIIFGYSMEEYHKLKISKLVSDNRKLSHLKLKEVRHDIFGKLEVIDFVKK